MNIVADENIPLLREFFGDLGALYPYPGRSLNADQVAEADVLLVRSVTQVNEVLLKHNRRINFVGSATIGLDHVDTDYLRRRQIPFANAPGCNAQSVVEYVISALVILAERQNYRLSDRSVGVIGRGQIGSRLVTALSSLGVTVKANDPPKQSQGEQGLAELEEVLACDIVSLHVPLVTDGAHATYQLINAEHLKQFKPSKVLINTSRGEVIDERALQQQLDRARGPLLVLDVYKGEPRIDPVTVNSCLFATPHIAGYSLEGRTKGTEMLYQAFCRLVGLPIRHQAATFMPEAGLKQLVFSAHADPDDILRTSILSCYDLRRDDGLLRHSIGPEADQRARAFDQLRRGYRQRRSFSNTLVTVSGQAHAATRAALAAVGFAVEAE